MPPHLPSALKSASVLQAGEVVSFLPPGKVFPDNLQKEVIDKGWTAITQKGNHIEYRAK